MDEMLSQEEIDALLKREKPQQQKFLTEEEIDALGEIGNISMGTSATTLYSLLRNRVTITTPNVGITDASQVTKEYPVPFLAINVKFTEGIEGTNMLLVKEKDAKVIADLMMGGDGKNPPEELDDLAISAVSEAMNQMIGSAATSLSTILDKPVHISPPEVTRVDFGSESERVDFFAYYEEFVRTRFKMIIGDLIDSEIMQLLPIDFSKEMVAGLMDKETNDAEYTVQTPSSAEEEEYTQKQDSAPDSEEVKVQPVTLKDFGETASPGGKENINLILDVPLNVTVELGRTKKQIRDILQFGVGTIVELDKLAGEPVEIMVNGKFIAKGEVVVIDENFGVRITDIVHPSKRIDSISQ